MPTLLDFILPGHSRRHGRLEKRLAAKHKGSAGVIVGFRGPNFMQRGITVRPEWFYLRFALDDNEPPTSKAFSFDSKPAWKPCAVGLHKLVIYSCATDLNVPLLSVEIVVGRQPTIVAVWPEYNDILRHRPARTETYTT